MAFLLRRNNQSDLERALNGIFYSNNGEVFTHRKDGVMEKQISRVYVLPYEQRDGRTYCLFNVSNVIAECRTAFYFTDGKIKIGDSYIDFERTNIKTSLVYPEDQESLNKDNLNNAHTIAGIRVNGKLKPVITLNLKSGAMAGYYYNHEGHISEYEYNEPGLSNEIKKWLDSPSTTPSYRCEEKLEKGIAPDWNNPKSIVEYLNRFVVGQDEAKKTVAVAFSNYMTKVRTRCEDIRKENILLIGPSGVGKTYMISLLAKVASLPYAETKLSGKSSEGYKGENLSVVFEQIRAKINEETPYGIVFLDEIDKLVVSGEENHFGPRLQSELIAWLEEARINGDGDKEQKKPISTKNILFVTAGAFQGQHGRGKLEDLITRRIVGKKRLGFGAEPLEKREEAVLDKVTPEDIIEYGLMPELVGRLPAVAIFNQLTNDNKLDILKKCEKSCLGNYIKLLSLKGFNASVEDEVLKFIVEHTPNETGARALFSACSDLFGDILYDPNQFADADKNIKISIEMAKEFIRGNGHK
jgi:ATP-dependent Clp protease ATP-binding subunit ClpX